MSPPFIRDATSGFWGFPTSTMDWCEENYAVTYYIAEFWNTISNVWFIFPPLLVALQLKSHKIVEDRFVVTLLSLTTVGLGSFAFHCTLLYHSQLLDELPMIYGTCCMFYTILQSNEPKDGPTNFIHLLIFSSISVFVTLIYIIMKDPLVFLWSYGVLAAISFVFHVRACIRHNCSKKLLLIATGSYVFGFILWNIDNEFCYKVRDLRSSLPYVLQPFLQLHAWWHFFAGVGTFLCIIYSSQLRIVCLGYEPELKLLYGCIPYFVKSCKKLDVNGNHQESLMKSKNRNKGSIGQFSRLL